MAAAVPMRGGRGRLSIGRVLTELRSEFPDVSISKIRFLEAEGLVEPERTPSGYRQFSPVDVERLRYILAAQRDHYLPLKVIGEHLDAMARGLEPPTAAGESPRAPRPMSAVAGEDPGAETPAPVHVRLSRAELRANSGLSEEQLRQVTSFGLISPRAGTEYFDADALLVATTVARLAEYGLEPRHIRSFKRAADREVGLIEQVVSPVAGQRGETASVRASAMVNDLGALSLRLHATLVRIGLRQRF